MMTAAENDPMERANVAVIATPREGDVAGGGEQIVRRIDIDPAEAVTVESDPGVRGIGARETWPPGRRLGFDVAAHIPGRQAERSQASDLNLREILTHTDTIFENFLKGRRDGRGFVIELEITINSEREIKHSLEDGTVFVEGRLGIISELLRGFDERRVENEFAR